MGTPEENSKFAAGLAAIAGDAGASLDVRCTAARGMKALKLSDAKDPGVWAAALGQLALAAVKAENSPVDPERLKRGWPASWTVWPASVVGTDKAHHSAAEDLKKAVVALRKAVDMHGRIPTAPLRTPCRKAASQSWRPCEACGSRDAYKTRTAAKGFA